MNTNASFRSIRSDVSPGGMANALDLAACYRLVDRYGMTDMIYNHITARVPGPEHHLLINLYGLTYQEITASSLVKIDLDGEIVWKPDTITGSTIGLRDPRLHPSSAQGSRLRDPHAYARPALRCRR